MNSGDLTGDLKKVLRAFLDFLFPAECTFCKGFLGEERFLSFCKSCWEKIKFIESPICFCCGKSFESGSIDFETASPTQSNSEIPPDFTCGSCREGFYYFDKARAVGKYEGVLKEAIHQFKYKPTPVGRGKPSLGKHLSELMVHHWPLDLKIDSFDLIIPVPLHKNRKQWRGFNQSEILARYLSRHYGIPLARHLHRTRETRPQVELTGSERTANVRGAFGIKDAVGELKRKKIVLVDDVFTTGATVNESSRVLKKAGVNEILVLTLARI